MAVAHKAGAQISFRAFIQSALILFVLMLAAGVLTLVIAPGSYSRTIDGGREVIEPQSFRLVERPDYPLWRWFTAPLEVLWGPDGVTIITIIIFLLMVGVAFAVLEQSGILQAGLDRIVKAFGGRKYLLLLVISFFFMSIGAFFGIFEEVVPLVPVMVALSYSLGWDALVGLGMSILATNMGFSAAITNPFTIGVAQRLAGLPLFSGAWFRIPIFIVIYAIFAVFLVRYARRVERHPEHSPVYLEEKAERQKYASHGVRLNSRENLRLGRGLGWLLVVLVLIFLLLLFSPFIPFLSQISLPLIGLLFFMGGVGAGLFSGSPAKEVFRSVRQGLSGISPAIPLILMAVSVKHIVANGGVMDTILYSAAQPLSQASPFVAVLIIYAMALLVEFFIGSGSAKAFLMMPILLPLADLVGVTRQLAVTAYCFGDGFSNLAYPTNPVLLISLGLTVVSYPKWLRWTLKLWFWVLLATLLFLGLGVMVRLGPF